MPSRPMGVERRSPTVTRRQEALGSLRRGVGTFWTAQTLNRGRGGARKNCCEPVCHTDLPRGGTRENARADSFTTPCGTVWRHADNSRPVPMALDWVGGGPRRLRGSTVSSTHLTPVAEKRNLLTADHNTPSVALSDTDCRSRQLGLSMQSVCWARTMSSARIIRRAAAPTAGRPQPRRPD